MGLRSLPNVRFINISVISKLIDTVIRPLTWQPLLRIKTVPHSCRRGYSESAVGHFTHLGDFHGSQSTSLCSKMATPDVIVREARLPVVNFSQNEFNKLKNDGNGLSKAVTDVVSLSASCLQNGGVIAVPTDTIYGVACLAQNTEAIGRIYEIKNRNFQNPVAISVADIDDIYRWSNVTVSREVLNDLLPGPVTVVFERSPELNPSLNPHTRLIGIRIPDHMFIQKLAKLCKTPIALTSANISGASSCLQVEEFQNLWPKLDLVVNGGKLSDTEESRSGSTVVDLSVPGAFCIIRPGSALKATVTCLLEKHKLVEVSSKSHSR